jgi:hypothetical protein
MSIPSLALQLVPYLDLSWDACSLGSAGVPDEAACKSIAELSPNAQSALVLELQKVAEVAMLFRGHTTLEARWCALSQAICLIELGLCGTNKSFKPSIIWTPDIAAEFFAAMLTLDDDSVGCKADVSADFPRTLDMCLRELIVNMTKAERTVLANEAVELRRDEMLTHDYKNWLSFEEYLSEIAELLLNEVIAPFISRQNRAVRQVS